MESDTTRPMGDATQRAGAEPAPAEVPSRIGRYEIRGRLGAGGMGTVYRAFDPVLSREVALKTLRGAAEPDLVERFLREARSAARLKHPGIVPVHDQGSEGAVHYFTMDIVEGKSFAEAIADGRLRGRPAKTMRSRPLLLQDAVQVVADVARAVGYAHAEGIVHRDLKPANVLLDADGRPHVSDFGLAKDLSASELTRSGDVFGTPYYMSPEQADGRVREVGPASDVFSLGAMLYEAITRRRPFAGANAREVCRHVVETEPAAPRRIDPAVPRDLETICLKALEKAADRRYASGAEMADELDRFLDGEPISARPLSALGRVVRMSRRHLRALVWLGVALLALATIVHARGLLAAEDAARLGGLLARARAAERAANEARGDDRGHAYIRACTRWLDVTSLDPNCAEAREASQRDTAVLQRLGVTLRDESSWNFDWRASEDGQAALEVLSEWRALRRGVSELEREGTNDGILPPGEGGALGRAEVQSFAAVVRSSAGARATAAALVAWTRFLDRDSAGAAKGIAQAHAHSARVPFAALAEALSAVADSPAEALWPTFAVATDDLTFGPSPLGDPAGKALARRLAAIGEALPEGPYERNPVFATAYAGVRGLQALAAGRLDEAEGKLSLAIADERLWVFEAELRRIRAGVRYAMGDIEGCLADVAVARQVRPGQAALHDLEGLLLWAKARRERTLRRDPEPDLERAVKAISEAAHLDIGGQVARVGSDTAWIHVARVCADLVRTRVRRGADPNDDVEGIVAWQGEVIANHPGDPEALSARAAARIVLAEALAAAGQDPRAVCEAAVADLVEVRKTRMDDPGVPQAEAFAWLVVARADAAAGRDPESAASRAASLVQDLDALTPPAGRARYLRAEALRIRIEARLARGEFLGRELDDADSAYDDAVRFASDPVEALTGRGWLAIDQARDRAPRGAKGANCVGAFGDFDRALALDASCVDALRGRAEAHLTHAAAYPTEPETLGWLDSAVSDLREAARLRPHDAHIAPRLKDAEEARAAAHPPK